MLEPCPECELPVSDKASSCPHCGYPLSKHSTKKPTREKSHMRLPNIIKEEAKKLYKLSFSLNSKNFICDLDGSEMTYDKYNKRFHKICEELGLNKDHRPHDPRKHFVTIAKKYNVDEYAIKRIIGHSINDLTEKVYTDRDVKWLRSEINKIKE